jgi:hypothetical protein
MSEGHDTAWECPGGIWKASVDKACVSEVDDLGSEDGRVEAKKMEVEDEAEEGSLEQGVGTQMLWEGEKEK